MALWHPIPGYEGIYEISYTQLIRRVFDRRKNSFFYPTENLLKGYKVVDLYKNGSVKKWFIHRLVGITFVSNPDNKPHINHKNGIKTDNRPSNLEWCTIAENNRHAREMGLFKRAYRHKIISVADQNRSVKVAQYAKDGTLIGIFGTMKAAALSVKRTPSQIHKAIHLKDRSPGGYLWALYGGPREHPTPRYGGGNLEGEIGCIFGPPF